MRNRQFPLPSSGSILLNNSKLSDWKCLKNRFIGRRLFRDSYFDLVNGEISVIKASNNKSFLDNILNHSISRQDKFLVPVLQYIASDDAVGEQIRQRSSEILRMSWVGNKPTAGTRAPQTSEILKLLKAQSIDSRRLAICLIGKFKITDMAHEVVDCLGIRGLEADSKAVLRSFGNKVGNELRYLYLRSSGNINTSKAILRVLSDAYSTENTAFLYERLWSNSREIKEVALNCLLESDFEVPAEDSDRFKQLLVDIAGAIVWIISAQACLKKSNESFLLNTLNRELIEWKNFLMRLFSLSSDIGNGEKLTKVQYDGGVKLKSIYHELLDNDLNEKKKTLRGFLPGILTEERKLNRIYRVIPGKVPEYKDLIEDLLNRDYNFISIWTKACALRTIQRLEDKEIEDSVVALMFSPEDLLQEEAARVLARLNMGLYRTVSQRIPSLTKIHLDTVISSGYHDEDLLFEKSAFLSGLFPEIPEVKLLFLAKEMRFSEKFTDNFLLYPEGTIQWKIQKGMTSPATVNIILGDIRESNEDGNTSEEFFFYFLDLDIVENFHLLFPEHSFAILKYIDDNELSDPKY